MAINPSFADACHASAIALPTLFGVEITNIHASAVTDFSLSSSPSAAWTKSQEYIGGDVGVMGSYRCVSP